MWCFFFADNELSRSYTPVPISLFTKYTPQSFVTDNVCLMVKSYENGNVSKHICSKNEGDILETSKSLGSFHLDMLEKKHSFVILAAGTGITPMLGIILFLLARRTHKWFDTKICLRNSFANVRLFLVSG